MNFFNIGGWMEASDLSLKSVISLNQIISVFFSVIKILMAYNSLFKENNALDACLDNDF